MDGVGAALRKMLGPNVGIGVTDPLVAGPVWPEETAAIAHAVPKRRTEFAAGRNAARHALAQLNRPLAAIPQARDRAPVWPAGIVGSISHCVGCCIAVVAGRDIYQTLGVDVEPAVPLNPDLIPVVCTQTEQDWLAHAPDPGLAAKMIFCAKEAIYKAQYPLTGRMIGFDAVSISFEDTHIAISAKSDLPDLKGTILIREGLILAVAHD